MDSATKNFIAVGTLVVAIFLGINHFVDEAAIEHWWVAGLFLAVSLVFWVWLWLDAQEAETAALVLSETEVSAPLAQEWIISKEVVAAARAAEARSAPHAAKPVAKPPAAEVQTPPTPPAPEPIAEVEPAAKSAPPVVQSDAELDDLTRVEGVGPKYRDVLVAAGINSYAAIAAASVEQLTDIVREAGMRRPASIETWPEQAGLLAADDDQAFKELIDKLKGGRRS